MYNIKHRPKVREVALGGDMLTVKGNLEAQLAVQIFDTCGEVKYEELTLKYELPATSHRYTPDFELPNGIIVEGKGIFDKDERDKQLAVRAANPNRDIRLVFQRANTPIRKGSPTTYAAWCDKHGFKWAQRTIPAAWFQEERKCPA